MYLTRAAKRRCPEYAELIKQKEEKENEIRANKAKPPTFIKYPGKYKYTTDFITCAEDCDDLLQEAEKVEGLLVLGFDLEWPFDYQTGPGKTALMQICPSTNNQIVYLFQLSTFKKLPATLTTLLSHPKVRLAGVNIRNDIHKLSRDFALTDKEPMLINCIDSRTQANEVSALRGWSMDSLTNYCFHKSVNKDKKVRNSKWNILPLSDIQKIYAATDAYISLELYSYLLQKKIEEDKEELKTFNPLLELL